MKKIHLVLTGLALALLAFGLPGSEDTPAPRKMGSLRVCVSGHRAKTTSPVQQPSAGRDARVAGKAGKAQEKPAGSAQKPASGVTLASAAERTPERASAGHVEANLRQAKGRLIGLLWGTREASSQGTIVTADLRPMADPRSASGSRRDAQRGAPEVERLVGQGTEPAFRSADAQGPEEISSHPAATLYDYTGASASDATEQGWTLPQPAFLANRGIRYGGWIDQGVSLVANRPADRYNGVVTFNDRDGEYQMNQLYFFLERQTDTACGGWDLGGRVDFLYGTDARFTQAIDGLEASWGQTERFYQAALPQFYLDVSYNGWTLRAGHFYTILGYEVVPATGNFFYSHAYTHQYGEPFTHTGLLLIRQFGERLKLSAGLHRGNDQFDDTDGLDSIDFLGGLTWTSQGGNFSVAFAITAGEQGPGVDQTIYSLVATWKATERLRYVIQHDYGWTDVEPRSAAEGQWYGINQYVLCDINACWSAGMRFEWFRDDDGTRVRGLGDGNRNQGPFEGNFYEVTAGLNWHPNANVTVRPEIRWDWYDSAVAAGPLPYDAGGRDDQFLFGCDLVVTY